MSRVTAPIAGLRVSAYTIPTDAPESDGTLEWNATTLVLVVVSDPIFVTPRTGATARDEARRTSSGASVTDQENRHASQNHR